MTNEEFQKAFTDQLYNITQYGTPLSPENLDWARVQWPNDGFQALTNNDIVARLYYVVDGEVESTWFHNRESIRQNYDVLVNSGTPTLKKIGVRVENLEDRSIALE